MTTLKWTEFAAQLIASEDLDPLYSLIAGTNWSWERKARYVLAFSMFYHAGVASFLSERKSMDFYLEAERLAKDSTTPRGSERRHFRAANAAKCIDWFRWHYEPEHWVERIADADGWKARYRRIQEAPAFGPWISFKLCDFLDRVLGKPTDWAGFGLFDLYAAPLEGASLIGAKEGGSAADGWALLLDYVSGFKAPPACDRPCGIAEAETVACKYKSHLGGKYVVGKDIKEMYHALKPGDDLMRVWESKWS